MDIAYEKYEYVILDAAALLYPLDQELWENLEKLSEAGKLCAASTLKSDLREYRAAFRDLARIYPGEYNSDRLKQLEENIRELNRRGIVFSVFEYTDYGPEMQPGVPHHDVWSLTGKLKNRKTLLVTGSETLFQRVVLDDGITVDLLSTDPKYEQKFFAQQEQRSYKLPFELETGREPLDTPVQGEQQLTLYYQGEQNNSNEVQLEKNWENGSGISGTESWIYRGVDAAAKVYMRNKSGSQPIFTRQLQKNIRKMAAFAKEGFYPWVMFPVKLLYHTPPVAEEEDRLIVGYEMERLKNGQTFVSNPHFEEDDSSYAESLQILLTTLRRIMVLNSCGILVLDYSQNNFWYDEVKKDVQFLDACSFSYGTYTSHLRTGDLTPRYPYKSDPNWLKNKTLLIQEHLDLTHLFAASMLMYGQSVESAEDQTINFLVSEGNTAKIFAKLVPPNLKDLFRELYRADRDPGTGPFSLEILLEELSRAVEAVKDRTETIGELYWSEGDLEEPELFQRLTFPKFDDGEWTVECVETELPSELHTDRNEEEHSGAAEPGTQKRKRTPQMRQRVFLAEREYPPVRSIKEYSDPGQHLSRRVRALPDPLPPVYQWGKRGRPVRQALMTGLLALTGLLAADALCFSGSDLGFSIPLYLEDRLQMIAQWLQQLGDLLFRFQG